MTRDGQIKQEEMARYTLIELLERWRTPPLSTLWKAALWLEKRYREEALPSLIAQHYEVMGDDSEVGEGRSALNRTAQDAGQLLGGIGKGKRIGRGGLMKRIIKVAIGLPWGRGVAPGRPGVFWLTAVRPSGSSPPPLRTVRLVRGELVLTVPAIGV